MRTKTKYGKVVSFYVTFEAQAKLIKLCAKHELSKSEMIDKLIKDKFEGLKNNDLEEVDKLLINSE